ncbi:MAG: 6-bladed beta-propeller [Desulfuromonadaceae bacterium]|nr:6-bladed beta-propeller [Desulfuromonadaceae bacterium]
MTKIKRLTDHHRPWVWALLLIVLLLGGCLMTPSARPPLPQLIWPEPPEIPRITLINIVHGPADLGIRPGLLRRAWSALAGHSAPEIQSPHGLSLDASGRLYVVDKVLRQVHVFDQQGQRYQTIPTAGSQLLTPIDVAIDDQRGRIFVSDPGAGAVHIFSRDGQPVGEIRRGLIGRPTGLAINSSRDELLVIDSAHASLVRFSLADLEPRQVIGHLGEGEGLFNAPTAVTIGRDGRIYVVDTLNHRVQILTAEGVFVGTFGAAGDGPGYFSRPKAVAIDRQGNIHVVDALFDNIQVFDAAGRLLMAYGGPGYDPGRFWLPAGIASNGKGKIYVADTYNRRVQIFQFLEEGELPE